MSALQIASILEAKDFQVDYVECPEWGGKVYLRSMMGEDVSEYVLGDYEDDKETMAQIVAKSLCDEDGNPQDVTDDQIYELGKKNGLALLRCFRKCVELSGLNEQALGEEVKN